MTARSNIIANEVKQTPVRIDEVEIAMPSPETRNDSSLYCHCERSEAISRTY